MSDENKIELTPNEAKMQLGSNIIIALKMVYDPEIPVNIYDLGLIYKIDVDDELNVSIDMTLTAPNCPMVDELMADLKGSVTAVQGVKSLNVNIVWEPPWDRHMMTDEARLELGMM